MRSIHWLACGATCLAVVASTAVETRSSWNGAPTPTSQPSQSVALAVAKADWRPNKLVRAIAVSKTRIFIAGDFTRLVNSRTHKKVKRFRVAAFNRNTGALISGFTPRPNRSVQALTLYGSRLVLGGDFTTINGKNRQHLGGSPGR